MEAMQYGIAPPEQRSDLLLEQLIGSAVRAKIHARARSSKAKDKDPAALNAICYQYLAPPSVKRNWCFSAKRS